MYTYVWGKPMRSDLVVSNRLRGTIWIAMTVIVLLCSLVSKPIGACNPMWCRLFGAVLLALSMRGAAVTGRYLAVYGSPARRGRGPGEPTRLVREGPYSCMRHPMHLFLSLFPLSLGLLASTSCSIIVGVAEAVLVLVLAVTIDEKESIARFGKEYIEYRKKVPAFSLRPRCLLKALGRRPPKHKE
jgi:protein-S-isoprenylcysteine O-methyltransferase Ste14